MTADTALAWYLYAVLDGAADAPVCLADSILPGLPGLPGLPDLPGLPGAAIHAVHAGGLAAVVSLVPRADFTAADHGARAADPDWVADRARAHHGIVHAIWQATDCLPLGFGTLFATEAGLCAWLDRHAVALRTGLRHLAGQAEWGLTLRCDEPGFAAAAEAADPAVSQLAAQAATASPGTAFLLQKRLVRARAAAQGGARAALAAHTGAALAAASATVRAEPPGAEGAMGWSLLLPRVADAPAILAPVLDHAASLGATPRLTGPWPPYCFARAALEVGNG